MDKKEIELRLADVLAMLLKAAKPIVCITLAFALLFGAYGAYRALHAEKNASVTQKDLEAAAEEVERASASVTKAERDLTKRLNIEIPDAETKVKRAEQLVDKRRSYIDNSLYYALDPFNYGVSRLTFYIETEDGSNPDMPWISVSPQASIATAYTNIYSVDNEILNNIRNIMNTDADIRYVRELISVSNVSDQFVQITVYHSDAQVAQNVVDYLYESLMERLNGNVGNFSANIIGRYTGYEVDWAMNENHALNEDNLISAERALSDAEDNVAALNEGVTDLENAIDDAKTAQSDAESSLAKLQKKYDESTLNTANVLRRTLRYAVIGLVAGFIGGCIIMAALGVMSRKLQNRSAVLSRYSFPIIGILPRQKKHLFDRQVRRLEGDPELSLEDAARSTAQSLLSAAQGRRACLISTEGSAVIDELVPYLEKGAGVCGNILKDADAVKALADYDSVFLVERRGTANLDVLENEVTRARALGKDILGIVLC